MHCILLSPSIHAGCHGGPCHGPLDQKAEVCRLGPLGSGLGAGASNHVPQARLGAQVTLTTTVGSCDAVS